MKIIIITNVKRSAFFTFLLFFVSIVSANNFNDSDNLINNGGFEISKHRWILKGNAEITSDLSHKEFSSLKLTSDSLSTGYVFQFIDFPVHNYTFTTWIFPTTAIFKSKVIFVSDWDKTGFKNILELTIANDTLHVLSSDTTIKLESNILFGAWNKISINTENSGLNKHMYINEEEVSSFSSQDVTEIEALVIGDFNCEGCVGTMYFDDILFLYEESYDPPDNSHRIIGSFGLGTSFAGPTIGLGLSYVVQNHFFSLRYLKGDELQILLFAADPIERDSPTKRLREIALVYGIYQRNRKTNFSIAGGVGFLDLIDRGDSFGGSDYEKLKISEIGLALDFQVRMLFSKNWGFGMSFYSNINQEKSIYGILVNLQLGNF